MSEHTDKILEMLAEVRNNNLHTISASTDACVKGLCNIIEELVEVIDDLSTRYIQPTKD